MTDPRPATIDRVDPHGPAGRAGIRAGEKLVRVNGRTPRDYIDYRYLAAEVRVTLLLEDTQGKRRRIALMKPVDEGIGIRFAEDVFDGVIACSNRCAFCFVSQLPPGLRPALYLRDDDYRLSFLHGNFVTLTNLTAGDRRRIARLHLSPLYVSVHATEPEVRKKLFGGGTPDVLREMGRLAERGIELHTQIVVCPGVNDGAHLERTVEDLSSLFPAVRSVGVVPVGLTRHRRQLPEVRAVDPDLARHLVTRIHGWQRGFRRELGTRMIFASDELYLLSGIPLPGRAHYEDFAQLSNGIGCARVFVDRARRIRPPASSRALRVTLVTGEMALPLVEQLARRLAGGGGVDAAVCAVENRLLGRSVTTAGLLAGDDIARALSSGDVGDLVLVPGTAVREGAGFIDGVTLAELSRRVGVPVVAAASPAEAAAAIRQRSRSRGRLCAA
jgi:putative radical SAM enzyme (TIGR03279 family)